jgi:hypothetical protein
MWGNPKGSEIRRGHASPFTLAKGCRSKRSNFALYHPAHGGRGPIRRGGICGVWRTIADQRTATGVPNRRRDRAAFMGASDGPPGTEPLSDSAWRCLFRSAVLLPQKAHKKPREPEPHHGRQSVVACFCEFWRLFVATAPALGSGLFSFLGGLKRFGELICQVALDSQILLQQQ